MTAQNTPYRYFTCNGRLDNLVTPNCPAVSPGLLGDKDAAQALALASGWTTDGSRDFCPSCSAGRKTDEPAARRPRRAAPVPDTGQHLTPDGPGPSVTRTPSDPEGLVRGG